MEESNLTEDTNVIQQEENNRYVPDSFERENLSYLALLVEDILMTLMREYGLATVTYEKLFDISSHCLNFIFNVMPKNLTLEYIVEYVGNSIPDELALDDYKLLKNCIKVINSENIDLQQKAQLFLSIRPLFAIGIIEELQLCECIEKTFTREGMEDTSPDNYFFYIKNLTRKMTAGKYRFGILNFSKSNLFTDAAFNVSIKVNAVDYSGKYFRFDIIDHNNSNRKIRGECEILGLLTNLIITKYFLKQKNFSLVLEEMFALIESSLQANK